MALTDIAIKKAKALPKRYKLSDAGGLFIEVMPTGAKFFRYRFKLDGKESIYTLGEYPLIGLADARMLRDDARGMVKQGVNPNEQKRLQRAEQAATIEEERRHLERFRFNQLFELWFEHASRDFTDEYAKDIRERIEAHLLPLLGVLPVEDIKPADMIRALKVIEAKGRIETLKRIRQYASRIFRYGVGMGLCERDPVRDLPNDIFQKQTKTNYPHFTAPADLYQLLNAIDAYVGDVSVATALKLAPYVFLRPNELAGLLWSEVDLTPNMSVGGVTLPYGVITIQADRMKVKRGTDHLVPLTPQTRALIESMLPLSDGTAFVFPSPRSPLRPINEQTLNAGLHRLGFKGKHCAHGFRHTASTLLNEMGYNPDHVEKQLAHEGNNPIRSTYNKAQYLSGRLKMLLDWGNHLDSLREGATVIPIRKKIAR
ncbi:MAG: integrase arm-type DNA-binding domain-containing protein [Thiomicrospira sp.]